MVVVQPSFEEDFKGYLDTKSTGESACKNEKLTICDIVLESTADQLSGRASMVVAMIWL